MFTIFYGYENLRIKIPPFNPTENMFRMSLAAKEQTQNSKLLVSLSKRGEDTRSWPKR